MNLRFFRLRSLKTRVTLFTLAIFIVGIWSLSWYASGVLREDMRRVLGEQQFATTSVLARDLNDGLNDRMDALHIIAREVTPAMLSQPAKLQALLEQRPLLQPLFSGGTWAAGLDGVAIADVPRSAQRRGTSFISAPLIAAALKEGKAAIGRPVIGIKRQTPLVPMAVPIRDAQGAVIGVLSGVTDLDKPNFMDKIAQNSYGKTGGYLLIDPKHGLFVTATDKSRVMQPVPAPGINAMHDRYMTGYEGFGLAVNSRGVLELSAAKGIPAAGWFVVATLPAQEAFAPVDHLMQRLLVGAALFTLLAGAATWWLISRMLQRQLAPMLTASRAMTRQADTGQPAQALPVAQEDEIGELIGGFNRLMENYGQREEALRASDARYRSILQATPDAILITDLQTRIQMVSPTGVRLMNSQSERDLIGRPVGDFLAPHDRDRANANIALMFQGVMTGPAQYQAQRSDGSAVFLEANADFVRDAQNEPTHLVFVVRDVTNRKLAEERLQLAASVFGHAREGILITDPRGTIIDVNDAFTRITGYGRQEALGQNPRMLSSGRQDAAFYATLWRALKDQGHWSGEIWNRRKSGEVYAELLTISAVRDTQGQVLQYVALFSDISAIKTHQSQLEHIAHFDALTNLPNRVLLADRLQQAMAQVLRRGRQLAVAYLDLDGFKTINDRHGHEVGDQVLVILAQRMKEALREEDTLARLGGDEFVVVLIDLVDTAACLPMLTRLLAAVAQPVPVGELTVQVSASLGVSFCPQAQDIDADQLLRQADQAMYQAKVAGKNRYHVFDAERDSSIRGHHESLERIRLALAQREFVLYYQPKVNMRTGQVIGAEALIRWLHPEQGLMLPGSFLPVIEDHALAVAIGEWVIDTALSQMERWHAAGLEMPVSVNIGAHQLQQADFVDRLRAILAAHPQVPAHCLELEVLETSALEDMAQVSRVIEACAQMGVMFALDDFGTGYSSLTYLKRLHVALLKIDQSFVRNMLEDPDDLAILQGVIGLAAAFKRQVIAEGVETVAHGSLLLQLGCELAQGYGIARPMPADQLPAWAATWKADPAWLNRSGRP
ncbi:MAG: EAL domain-containing protein [Burkholderiaceae bacterium]|nr:EAL domain-containing protein [Burkholderiaceae bacterium]